MSGGNTAPALVRTGVPMGVGSALIFAAKAFGLELTVDQALILAPVVMWLYYVLGRALESFDPRLGYVLGIAKAPAYSPQASTSPDRGEELVAVVVSEGTDPQVVQEVVESSTAVDTPVDDSQLPFESVEAHEPSVTESEGPDVNVGLLASHAGPSPIDAAATAQGGAGADLTITPLADLQPAATSKAPAKRAPRKKPAPPVQ